jgi:hypothetical protein
MARRVKTEFELKLAVPVRALRDAQRLPWLQKLMIGPVSRRRTPIAADCQRRDQQ